MNTIDLDNFIDAHDRCQIYSHKSEKNLELMKLIKMPIKRQEFNFKMASNRDNRYLN